MQLNGNTVIDTDSYGQYALVSQDRTKLTFGIRCYLDTSSVVTVFDRYGVDIISSYKLSDVSSTEYGSFGIVIPMQSGYVVAVSSAFPTEGQQVPLYFQFTDNSFDPEPDEPDPIPRPSYPYTGDLRFYSSLNYGADYEFTYLPYNSEITSLKVIPSSTVVAGYTINSQLYPPITNVPNSKPFYIFNVTCKADTQFLLRDSSGNTVIDYFNFINGSSTSGYELDCGDLTDCTIECYDLGSSTNSQLYTISFKVYVPYDDSNISHDYLLGYDDGYRQGYFDGSLEGFDIGYQQGETDGYSAGYSQGIIDSTPEKSILLMILQPLDALMQFEIAIIDGVSITIGNIFILLLVLCFLLFS